MAQFLVTLASDAPATEQRSDKNKPTFRHFALKLYRKFDSTNENFLRDKNGNKNGNNNNLARFILDLYIYSRRQHYILLVLIIKIIIIIRIMMIMVIIIIAIYGYLRLEI